MSEKSDDDESGGKASPPFLQRVRGPGCSIALHALVFLALLAFPHRPPPLPAIEAVPVDLVQAGETTASPSIGDKAGPAPEAATTKAKEPETIKERATPQPAAPEPSLPPRPSVRPSTGKPAGSRHRAAPVEDFDARLRAAARASPSPRGGRDAEDLASAGGAGVYAPHATVSVKDLVRAQVVRHWNFNATALRSQRRVAVIHVVLNANGTVAATDMIVAARDRTDPVYLEFVRSALNAVRVSSPLQLPAGTTAAERDMVLEFDPRLVLR